MNIIASFVGGLLGTICDPFYIIAIVSGCVFYKNIYLSLLSGATIGCLLSIIILSISPYVIPTNVKIEIFIYHIIDGIIISLLSSLIIAKIKKTERQHT